MLLLGIDLGTSFIKVSVVDAAEQSCVASAKYPETEAAVLCPRPGWAEQSPDQWWEDVKQAILKCHSSGLYDPADIAAVGIAYQMHGLVVVDKQQQVLRNAIIWSDSRAVEIGNKAFTEIGEDQCLSQLLNSPGNFTASKLAWVKANEPGIYESIDKFMLPGDFIAMKMTGEISTTSAALSEGIFWDFKENRISDDVIEYFEFNHSLFPEIKTLFAPHGYMKEAVASRLSLKSGIPVSYKAGDQPNNALSLNVLRPGEIAATAGTSGVVYAVSDELTYDKESRVNSFAHVNHTGSQNSIGVLLCINGCGATNKWIRQSTGTALNYQQMNDAAATVKAGSNGLQIIPFGNGAERMLGNKIIGTHFHNLDNSIHSQAHLFMATQEGIAFAFRYGIDIMRENNIFPAVIRAGNTNMFLSAVFAQAFVDATDIPVELHECDGSIGAAIGAGIGAGVFKNAAEAFSMHRPTKIIEPKQSRMYHELYDSWKETLLKIVNKTSEIWQS